MEQWVTVPDFEDYEVSNHGRVRSKDRVIIKICSLSGNEFHQRFKGKLIKPCKNKNTDHLGVILMKNKKRHRMLIHRLVLIAFVGCPDDGLIGCHNDGNPKNNYIDNLRWDTYKSNVIDSINHGTRNILKGEQIKNSKLTEKELIKLREIKYYRGMYSELAKKHGMTLAGIRNAIKGISWKHIKS